MVLCSGQEERLSLVDSHEVSAETKGTSLEKSCGFAFQVCTESVLVFFFSVDLPMLQNHRALEQRKPPSLESKNEASCLNCLRNGRGGQVE